jgi:MoaA/NifB/PqqE/SkfB family radical SAM enzyme
MRFIGRDIDPGLVYPTLRAHPYASAIQAAQKLRRATSLDQRMFSGGWSLPPSLVTLEITHRCNLRCATCWLWGSAGRYAVTGQAGVVSEMSVDQVKRLIDDIAWFRPYFLLTGGEPLLYRGIEEVVRYAAGRGLIAGMITNGMLGAERLESVIDAGLSFLTVSMDSADAKTHDTIRGREGSHANCLRALEVVRAHRAGKRRPVVTINLTVSDYNYADLSDMADTAEQAGADILQINHQWFSDAQTSAAYSRWASEHLGLQSNHIGTFGNEAATAVDGAVLYDQIQVTRRRARLPVRVVPDLSLQDTVTYYGGMNPVANRRCVSPWYAILVKPNGDAVPCIDYRIGNVTDAPFRDIWNSQKMKTFRRKLREQHYFPGCTRCCGFFEGEIAE